MTQITKEAIEAAHAVLWERDKAVCSQNSVEAALTAALPFLPIAVEGKVTDVGNVAVIEQCAKLCDLIANRPVQGPEGGAWERAERYTAKRLAADIRALSPSSPGKDGGQEVEEEPVAWTDRTELMAAKAGSGLIWDEGTQHISDADGPIALYTRPQPASTALVEREAVADQIIGQIEERFPNWRSYRDLIDCIDCTLAALAPSQSTSREGER